MEIRYTPLEQAAEIMGNRRADTRLQARVRDFLGEDVAEGPFSGFEGQAPAVRAEYVARPTLGDLDFMRTAVRAGLQPWTVTKEGERYTSTNEKKANMLRPCIALPKGQVVRQRITEGSSTRPQSFEGFAFDAIPTVSGGSLTDWWGDVRRYVLAREDLAGCMDLTYDISGWYYRQSARSDGSLDAPSAGSLYSQRENAIGASIASMSEAARYYTPLMGLYAGRAALFCDYSQFPTFRYAEPAFEAAAEALGVDPIIVAWRPQEEYPRLESPDRLAPEYAVDFSDVAGLTVKNLSEWLQSEVLR